MSNKCCLIFRKWDGDKCTMQRMSFETLASGREQLRTLRASMYHEAILFKGDKIIAKRTRCRNCGDQR